MSGRQSHVVIYETLGLSLSCACAFFILISILKKLRIELTDRSLPRFQLQSATHVGQTQIILKALKTELTWKSMKAGWNL